jgi:S-DNA-T family DNA segregation ATPase FtsK/SpoIIIE
MYDVAMQTLRDTVGSSLIHSGVRSEGQILPQVYAERWCLVGVAMSAERPRIVQVANFEGSQDAARAVSGHAGGLSAQEATELTRWTAHAIYQSALQEATARRERVSGRSD